jgi:RNA polymerase sigma-70 factor (ECF subfamily)
VTAPLSSSDSPLSESELIARIRAGDEAAFETLVETHYAGLYRFARRYVHERETAEDLVHDVLFRVWQQREQWDIRESLATYLYGAVRNRAINYLRHDVVEQRWRASASRHSQGDDWHRRPEQADAAVELSDLDRAITRAVERLPPRCRQVFELSREHGLSYAEIAAVMEIAPKTVQIQMGRALKALRAALKPFLP